MQEFTYKLNEDGTYAVVGYQGNDAEVIIPDTYGDGIITVIGDGIFSGHTEITSVKIPDTVRDMGEFIFDGCLNLHNLKLPKDLEALWGYTFVRCGIEEIVLPDKLVTLPPFAFKDCKNLKKVVCGKGLKKIYSWVFSGCENLTELDLNDGVKISPRAFDEKELNT